MTLLENARLIGDRETAQIARSCMVAMVDVYGREWIAGFTLPALRAWFRHDNERIMALLFAHEVLQTEVLAKWLGVK